MVSLRRGLLISLIALGACNDPGGPQAPWVSGTRVRAQLYVGDQLEALAGRTDATIGLTCAVDPTKPMGFASCPPRGGLYYRDVSCAHRDVIRGLEASIPVGTYAVALVDGVDRYYHADTEFGGAITDRDDVGTCTIPATGPGESLATEVDAATVGVGAVTAHTYQGVHYSSLDTRDGFSAIVAIEGETPVVDDSPGRIRVRYGQKGVVRRYLGMFDHDLGVDCVAMHDQGGQLRCAPSRGVHNATADQRCRDSWVPTLTGPGAAVESLYDRVDMVYRCDQPSPVPMYEPASLLAGGCRQVEDPHLCTEIPVSSLATLSLTTA